MADQIVPGEGACGHINACSKTAQVGIAPWTSQRSEAKQLADSVGPKLFSNPLVSCYHVLNSGLAQSSAVAARFAFCPPSPYFSAGSKSGKGVMGTNSSLSARISRSNLLRYTLAVLSALLGAAMCAGLQHFVGIAGCYAVLLLAVTFSAWYCGAGPALVSVLLCLIAASFGFVPRLQAFTAMNIERWVGILVFLAGSVVVVLMGEWRRADNERLLRAQDELEDRVRERTADLDVVNRNLRELSARLMQLQDDGAAAHRARVARQRGTDPGRAGNELIARAK